MVKPTKADRDAAARLNGYANWEVWEAVGQHDEDWMTLCARDFDAHRLAGIAEGRGQMREEAAQVAYRYFDGEPEDAEEVRILIRAIPIGDE